ncbi:hypothetical protein CFT13S00388_09045 [Campylobacter fetus subsp. testudinum]|uniref:hypothetical protein n=1 Tax=Campylobacter fetus TaxID=196 RepID=UPI000818889B|nr:hypothetical protein [Campylobacter fetus]OCR86451.1 hypothetical protein CFT13S00388_09045 [Campylobacter fetus subsp. testudinum]
MDSCAIVVKKDTKEGHIVKQCELKAYPNKDFYVIKVEGGLREDFLKAMFKWRELGFDLDNQLANEFFEHLKALADKEE